MMNRLYLNRGLLFILTVLTITLNAFALDCVVTTSFDRNFQDKWTHFRAGSSPYLFNRDTVYAGFPLSINVLFKEYSRNAFGFVDISFSCKIIGPDNTTIYKSPVIRAVSGLMTNDTSLLLSSRIPSFSFSGNNRPGTYRLVLTAEDRISDAIKSFNKNIILSKYPATAMGGFTDVSFNVWVHSYCLDPDPGRAIEAFSYFIGSKISNDNDLFWPLFYFFQCLFGDNPALVQKLAANISTGSSRLQEYSVFLLRSIQVKKSDLAYPVPDSLWVKFDKAAAPGFFDPFTVAFASQSNRLMEFAFYYYGNYSIIRFLIDCLGINSPAGYDAFVKSCKEYCDLCPENLNRENALQLSSDAGLILGKTISKHPLINAYCNFALAHDTLEAGSRNALIKLIGPSYSQPRR